MGFLLAREFFVNIGFFVGHVVMGHGIFVFLVGHEIFFFFLNMGLLSPWNFLTSWWWAKSLFCRTSRVEVALKCWKVYGENCLLTLGTLSMTRNFFRGFIELGNSWVQGSLVAPCFVRMILGYHIYFPFFGHWRSNFDTLWLFCHHQLEIGWRKNQGQWFPYSKGD